MKKTNVLVFMAILAMNASAQTTDSLALEEVVVTGSRYATDVRHLHRAVWWFVQWPPVRPRRW